MTGKLSRLSRLRRIFVIIKITALRGYALLNVPFLAIIGAGVIHPYAQQYIPGIRFWQLAVIALAAIMLAGWLDRVLRLLHEEQNYLTETNPTLMKGLRGEMQNERIQKI